jgi:hypothetical protein
MSIDAISPLRQRMIEDMNARKLCAGTQTGHIRSCKRFAAFLKRSPDTATLEDIRLFQLHLAETGVSICNRNRIMTGLRFLFRVTLRRLDLAAEIYHIREPQKIPLVMSPDETKRLLAVASSLKARILLSRYTHRVAIANSRLIAFNDSGVTFRYKDYRADGRARYKRMMLATDEFIRRFLIHVLPHGFHRIRHYGLFANGNRAANIARARELLAVPSRPKHPRRPRPHQPATRRACCRGHVPAAAGG